MKTIAVTGADGFIGTNLVSALKHKKLTVKSYNHKIHSLEKINSLEKLVSGCDTVYHLAGLTNSDDPDLFKVNVLGTLNLLTAIRNIAPKAKLVFSSSFAVYSPQYNNLIITENSNIAPRNNYGLSKLLAEQAIINYQGLQTKPTILRFSNVYGPEMRSNAHSVVANFFDSILNNHEIKLNNDGKDTRDFVYVDDVVEALIAASKKDTDGVYNVCSGEEISISSLSQKIGKIANKEVSVNNFKSSDKSSYWKGDFTRAKKDLKWEPKITIQEGLKKIWQAKN